MHSLSSGNTSLEPKHSRVIELELRDISQLFNPMDPSPLEKKDLNDDVAASDHGMSKFFL